MLGPRIGVKEGPDFCLFFFYLASNNPSSIYDGTDDEGRPNKSSTVGASTRNYRCYIALGPQVSDGKESRDAMVTK
jgi:hypothetical protein